MYILGVWYFKNTPWLVSSSTSQVESRISTKALRSSILLHVHEVIWCWRLEVNAQSTALDTLSFLFTRLWNEDQAGHTCSIVGFTKTCTMYNVHCTLYIVHCVGMFSSQHTNNTTKNRKKLHLQMYHMALHCTRACTGMNTATHHGKS